LRTPFFRLRWLASTFGAAVAAAGLASFYKFGRIGWGIGWWAACILGTGVMLYPGRYNHLSIAKNLIAFCKAMEFTPEADIRCAIWVPEKNGNWLKQITNYLPTGVTGSGRRFQVSKGVIGYAYRAKEYLVVSLKGNEYDDAQAFRKYMMKSWGYDQKEANDLTSDRRAYLAAPIVNSQEEVVGILYCDSRNPDAFDLPETEQLVVKLTPFFAELLV
jgi:hypothetical protein